MSSNSGKRKDFQKTADQTLLIGNDRKGISPLVVKDYVTTVTILENIADAIFILNKDGRIEYANKSALDLLRIDLGELIGTFIDSILMDSPLTIPSNRSHPNRQTDRHLRLLEKLNNGVYGNLEAALVYNKVIVPVLLDFSIIHNKDNDAEYIIVSAKDITHRKILEKELGQQQALSISRDRLRALGELSVGLIHELSQPLATLKLQLELTHSQLAKNDGNGKRDSNFSEMFKLINKMSDIIQNMRAFSHQTEDDTIAVVSINNAVKNASKLVAYDLRKQNIKLVIKTTPQLPYIIANPLLIEQVIVNLLTNARDAFETQENNARNTENGGKQIKVISRAYNDKWVEFIVQDNAGGIDTSIKDKIFDPFFSTKEPSTNSGLGLSISRNIIRSLGGDIKVEGRVSQSTKIRVRIPISQKDERAQLFNLIELMHEN